MFANFNNRLLKFVKIRDFQIFSFFECKLYLRTAFIYYKSLQTVHVGVRIKHVIFLLLLLL